MQERYPSLGSLGIGMAKSYIVLRNSLQDIASVPPSKSKETCTCNVCRAQVFLSFFGIVSVCVSVLLLLIAEWFDMKRPGIVLPMPSHCHQHAADHAGRASFHWKSPWWKQPKGWTRWQTASKLKGWKIKNDIVWQNGECSNMFHEALSSNKANDAKFCATSSTPHLIPA